ncbi:MAG: putative DNA binding domain-containing protein [Clostridiales bacterium]|nr:putative DNA binding domain-containing protein [Clostridiales bacterium]
MMRTIPERETIDIEFKSDLKGLGDAALTETVVGMANTEGGALFLGVEDDGKITGIIKRHSDEIGVMALIANKTIPSVSVRAEVVSEEGKEVLRIEIPKSRSIVATTDGKILRRRLKLDGTPETVPMYPFEINTRLSELNLLDFSAQPISDATEDDLDPNERVRLRNVINMRQGDRFLLTLSDEELDKALCLTKEVDGTVRPTVTGMLLIGKETSIERIMPTAKTSFQVLEGTRVRINEQYSKPLLATFDIIENHFKAWNPEREMEHGMFRIPVPEFSENAFREGLVNALCHRDYSIMQAVRVAIDDEGLTISSPGGFVDGVNLKNLLTVEPHGRNAVLADALKRIGLAERTGRGIDRIFEGSIVFGRPIPDYSESTENCVKLFIQRREPDMTFARMIVNEEDRRGKSIPINSLLILSVLRENRRASIRELSERTNVSEARIEMNLEQLLEGGLVEETGDGRGRAYILSRKAYPAWDNAKGTDRSKYEDLILKFAKKQNNTVTRDNVAELLNISEDQAYRVLRAMIKEGKLVLVGKGRGSRYQLSE